MEPLLVLHERLPFALDAKDGDEGREVHVLMLHRLVYKRKEEAEQRSSAASATRQCQ